MSSRVLVRTALVFTVALAAGGVLVAQSARLEREERQRTATEVGRAAAEAIQRQLEGSLAAPYALAASVRQSGGVHEFERYSEELLQIFSGIDSLQLAPGGVLNYIHPLAGNELALGLDLMHAPLHRDAMRRAIETRRVVFEGPFPLLQGGIGIAARVAVFVREGEGGERFWGIASAVLTLPRLLEAAQLERLSDRGYAYELSTPRDDGSGRLDVVAASPDGAAMQTPVTVDVHLPGAAWTLAVAPHGGWGPGPWVLFQAVFALVMALALAAFAWRVFRTPEELARQVAERTDALRRASAEREAILAGIPDPAWLKDREGRFVAVNAALARLAGLPPEQVLGHTHAEVFGPASAVAVERNDAEVIAAGAQRVVEESVGAGDDTAVFEVVKRPYSDASGAVVGTIGIARDITERRKLEARVRQAEKMEAVGRLAGGIAHDFNNILTVVLGSASELRDGAIGPSQRELADEVVEGARRAAALTRQLLAFSRQQPLQPQDVDLNAIVLGLERMLRRVIPEDVAIETRLHGGAATVHADPGQLEQVVLNLVVNARDAMPSGGRLVIETDVVDRAPRESGVRGPCAVLAVRDTGAGMDASVRAHLFEPFFTTKGVGQGTGLGLATVLGIVEQSGGGVWVDSAPGAGTTIRVFLPRIEARTAARRVDGAAQGRGNETVLVVEDDPAVRALMSRALRGAGYQVLEAAAPEDALAIAAQRDGLDLLVTDVVMPGMNGRELAARLLAGRPALRVVFVSGYTEDAALRSGELPDGQLFLPKPFTGEAVAAAVRAALDARRARA